RPPALELLGAGTVDVRQTFGKVGGAFESLHAVDDDAGGIQRADRVEQAVADLIDHALNRSMPHHPGEATVNPVLDAIDPDALALRDDRVRLLEEPEEQPPLAAFQSFRQELHPEHRLSA